GTGSDVQLSYYGNTSSTTSPANGGYFRTNQAVGLVAGNQDPVVAGVTEGWSINSGTTQSNHVGYTSTGTVAADYAGDASITFTLSDIFSPALLSDTFTLAWAMTCSNDVIVQTFTLGNTQLTTPLPAALPLFASGLGAMGLFGWRKKRKAAAVAA
ncbi:MAG: PEP-CTERM sorting domain-containing protein, partial [Stellaceae bacterium]